MRRHENIVELIILLEKYFSRKNSDSNQNLFPFLRLCTWRSINNYNKKNDPSLCRISFILIKIIILLINYLLIFKIYNLFNAKVILPNADFLVYSPEQYYNLKIKEKRFSRIIDPFLGFIGQTFSFNKISFLGNIDNFYPSTKISKKPTLKLYSLKNLFLSIKVIFIYSRVLKINKLILALEVFQDFLKSSAYKVLFSNYLTSTKYSFVVTCCYYDSIQMGLISAAHSKNIITFDIQHGKQGPDHLMYCNLPNHTNYAFDSIPDFFLTWGNTFTENILRNAPSRNYHKPLTIGNLWIDYAYNYYKTEVDHELIKNNKKVLVSLQDEVTYDFVIPEFIEEIIQESPSLQWIFKPHPNYPNTYNFIKEFVGKYSNCDIFDDLMLPSIYSFLHLCDFHISSYSTVVHESIYFGIPSGVWSKRGFSSFRYEIQERDVFKLSCKPDVYRFLEQKKLKLPNRKYFAHPSKNEFSDFITKLNQ